MLKKVHLIFVSLMLSITLTAGFTGCSTNNSTEITKQTESITITSRTTTASEPDTLELTVAFANFATTPATVDVYVEGNDSPVKTGVAVTDGKISLDVSGYAEDTYKIYVKSGSISSNSISITITKQTGSGKIVISTEGQKGTAASASAIIHFKQSKDGKTYELENTENKTVAAGASLATVAKDYTGFTAQGLFLAEQPDGTNVINVYYTRNIVSVTLYGNGGKIKDNETYVQKGLYGTDFPQAKDLKITHDTKVFGCWNTKADGTGTDYKDTEGFSYTENLTLYAKWLDSYDLKVEEAADKIKTLGSGSYTIKVSGAIKASDIEDIKNAMLTDNKRYIALDLSQTTGLTKLGEEAFTSKDGIFYTGAPLLSLVLPETVTEIGRYCFYNCNKMKTVYAPKVTTLKTGAFYVCESLNELTIADELDLIDSLAFGYCHAFSEITLNAKTIGNNVVAKSKGLSKIIIGPVVEEINNGAFQELVSLESFEVSKDNTHFKVDNGILYSSDGTRLIHYPAKLEATEFTASDKVTSIDEYAFAECNNLKKVSLPNVSVISDNSFQGDKSLTEVSIPKATKISGMAFYNCKELSSITLPDTLTYIGMYTFAYDTKITSIFIPLSVTTIKGDAFEYWTDKQTINCEAESKPSGWESDWSEYIYNTEAKATINWGATRE